jgi:hypothetical protein
MFYGQVESVLEDKLGHTVLYNNDRLLNIEWHMTRCLYEHMPELVPEDCLPLTLPYLLYNINTRKLMFIVEVPSLYQRISCPSLCQRRAVSSKPLTHVW